MLTFAKRRIPPPNAQQEVSNTNHFGSVSDNLGGLAAASECMASMMNCDYATILYSYENISVDVI